jgi:hypothetical protein
MAVEQSVRLRQGFGGPAEASMAVTCSEGGQRNASVLRRTLQPAVRCRFLTHLRASLDSLTIEKAFRGLTPEGLFSIFSGLLGWCVLQLEKPKSEAKHSDRLSHIGATLRRLQI